ncbi:mCG148028 [Mus musculus]|nr:mCG148028 [Mus musculus]
MWRLGEQAEEASSSAWNNKMIVFSAKLIDHTPRWAICLLKGHPGLGKVERREQRAVVTTRRGQPRL